MLSFKKNKQKEKEQVLQLETRHYKRYINLLYLKTEDDNVHFGLVQMIKVFSHIIWLQQSYVGHG